MSVVIFSGPSVPAHLARSILPEARLLGPAACGDVYRATRQQPKVIGLVDGYFDHRRSVWHKEILWALHSGIRVYGASSIGALRAVEMAPFGMVGCGWVYDRYRRGLIEDDDEVAIVHEPAEQGYRPRSDAMVNLRRTLEQGVADGALNEEAAAQLLSGLRREFYPQRSRRLLLHLAQQLLTSSRAADFAAWLEQHGVIDQKRLDAVEMLEVIREHGTAGIFAARPPPLDRPFEPTNAWQALLEEVERLEPSSGTLTAAAPRDDALAEFERIRTWLRTNVPNRCDALLSEAIVRTSALTLARARQLSVDAVGVQAESERFRAQRGLFSSDETERWLAAAGLDLYAFSALMHDNVLCAELEPEVLRGLLPELRRLLQLNGLNPDTAPDLLRR